MESPGTMEDISDAPAAKPVEQESVHIVSIEGGIGVGKSTVMDALRRERPSLMFIDEPVEKWEKCGLLKHMYANTINPGTFQIAALATRMAPILKAVREGARVIVTERCPWSDHEVFTKGNLEEGSVERTAYQMAFDALLTAMPVNVQLHIIYLRADVDLLMQRIAWRARDSERVDGAAAKEQRRAYLDKLQTLHTKFFAEFPAASRQSVDASLPAAVVAQHALAALSHAVCVKLEPLGRP